MRPGISIPGAAALALLMLATPRTGADPIRYAITDLGSPPGGIEDVNPSGLVSFSLNGQAALYKDGVVTKLGTLGGPLSRGGLLNDRGQVVGQAQTTDRSWHSYLYSGGTMRDLTAQAGGSFYAGGLNDRGEVVGTAGDLAAAYKPGQGLTTLGHLPGASTGYASAINERGQIVGADGTGASTEHAFLYEDGRMTDLGTLGGMSSGATAISSAGHVIGGSRTIDGLQHAFLYYAGAMHDLGTLGGSYSDAWGVNASGEVVGTATDASGRRLPYLYAGGTMVDLNSLLPQDSGWMLEGLHNLGIDDAGRITGDGMFRGEQHAFLLAPQAVPEPSTLAMLGAATVAVAACCGIRRASR